jgi:hypothetical protein
MATVTQPGAHPGSDPDRDRDRVSAGVVFDDVSWADYEAMLRLVGERPIRVTYDRGTMEILSPMWRHGGVSYLLGRLVDARFAGPRVPDQQHPVLFAFHQS